MTRNLNARDVVRWDRRIDPLDRVVTESIAAPALPRWQSWHVGMVVAVMSYRERSHKAATVKR